MTAEETGFVTACDVVVGRVVFSCWVVLILPVTVLGFVDCEPVRDVLVVALDYEGGVVEEVVDDLAGGPGSVSVIVVNWSMDAGLRSVECSLVEES